MQLMVEGDKWEMYIPSDLAYGDRGSPPKIGGGGAEGTDPGYDHCIMMDHWD